MANVEIRESGTLKDKSAKQHILEVAATSFKGVLVFGRAAEKKSFIFDEGKPCLPAASLKEGVLGKMLFEKNLMTADQFKKVKEFEASGKTFFEALIGSGAVSKDLVMDSVLDGWLQDMSVVVSWDAGQYAVVDFLPKDVAKVEITKSLYYYLFRSLILKNKKIKSKFTPTNRFEINPIQEFDVKELQLNDLETKVYNSLKASKTVKNLSQETVNPENMIAPIVYSLRDIGLVVADIDPKVKVKPVAQPQVESAQEAVFTAKEEKDYVSMIQRLDELDFFEILGVESEATSADIQARYFTLAKRYHPDRIKTKTEVPRKEIERLFAKITEAYNTLSNPASRKEYELKHSKEAAAHNELMDKIMRSESIFMDGKAMLAKNLFQGAADAFQEAIALYDQEPEYHVKLGWALFRLGVKDNKPNSIVQGKKMLVDAYNNDYLVAEVAYYLGMIAKHENKNEQAANYFRSCIQAEPTHSMAASELRLIEKKLEKKK